MIDFRMVGGVPLVKNNGDPNNPDDIEWNFGVDLSQPRVVSTNKPLYEAFPNLQGRWDGKSRVNHHEAVRKVLGKDIEPHMQPSGTCGGRAGSRTLELLQCILIASGKRAKFKYVSHAWPYFLARRAYGMLGRGDGVAGGSIQEVLGRYGALHREEANDPDMNSRSSDDIAVKWGAGRLSSSEVKRLEELASDNIVTFTALARSFDEMADGIAAGGIAICDDAQGYSMTRDSEGFCSPRGTWYHYHCRSGIGVSSRGRKYCDYNQSWGYNTPSGTKIDDVPDNVFRVDADTQDRLCRSGNVSIALSMPLWELESGSFDIPWIF